MLRKLTLALVAAASLGTVALAPTSASAWHKHHHHHLHGHGLHFGVGYRRPRLRRLLPHPHGADALGLSPAHRQRVPLLLIEPRLVGFQKAPVAARGRGFCTATSRENREGDAIITCVGPTRRRCRTSCIELLQIRRKSPKCARDRGRFCRKSPIHFSYQDGLIPRILRREPAGACGDRQFVLFF